MTSIIKQILKTTMMMSFLSIHFVDAADIKTGAKVIKEASKKIPLIKRTKKNALELAQKRVDIYLKVMSVKKSNIDPILYDRVIEAIAQPRSFLAKLEVLAPINKPGFEIGIIARFYDDYVKNGHIRGLLTRILSDSKEDFGDGAGYLKSHIPSGIKKLGQSFDNARKDGLLHGVVNGAEDIIAGIIKLKPANLGNHTKEELMTLQEIVVEAATKEASISPEKMLNTAIFTEIKPSAFQVKYVRSIDVLTLTNSESILQWWKQGLGANPSDKDFSTMYNILEIALDPIIEKRGVRDAFVSNVFIASRSDKSFSEIVEALFKLDMVDK